MRTRVRSPRASPKKKEREKKKEQKGMARHGTGQGRAGSVHVPGSWYLSSVGIRRYVK